MFVLETEVSYDWTELSYMETVASCHFCHKHLYNIRVFYLAVDLYDEFKHLVQNPFKLESFCGFCQKLNFHYNILQLDEHLDL